MKPKGPQEIKLNLPPPRYEHMRSSQSPRWPSQRPQARPGPEPKMESKNHLSPHLPVPEGPPDHQATAWQFHLTQTQLVAGDIRQSAGYLEHSYLIHNLDYGASGSSQQANLGCAAMVVKARPQPGHWAQLLVVAPQACRAKLALLPSSGYGSNSNINSAHSTSWNIDLVEWHMNCILQFLREHQPNAVEAAPDLEVVQNPLAKSQGVPDQQAMDDHLNLSDKQSVQ